MVFPIYKGLILAAYKLLEKFNPITISISIKKLNQTQL
jgi:hypothetical protein